MQTLKQTSEAPKANPERLFDLIREAFIGKLVVPEFQRSFVWQRQDIEELLSSILQGYFIGTFLVLDTQTQQPMFPFRLMEGHDKIPFAVPQSHTTVRLLLDGQQRISSLFYVLYEPDIPLQWSNHPHKFFLNLKEAIKGELDDAVIGISTRDKRRMREYEDLVQNYEALPFSRLRDSGDFYRWLYNEQKIWNNSDQKNIENLYQRIEKFMIPVVSLASERGQEDIVNIFERINRTGISLSLFDLVQARVYPKKILLRNLWENFQNSANKELDEKLSKMIKPEFLLKMITLWEGKEPKKGKILDALDSLNQNHFEDQWKKAEKYIIKAVQRIANPKGGYGAIKSNLIPYSTLIVPLAVLLHAVEERSGGETMYRKLDRWYWSNIFLQRYDSATDTKTYQDFQEMKKWLDQDTPPDWMTDLTIDRIDLDVTEQRSALYRGIMCLIVLAGAKDFFKGQTADLMTCEDDHIFPKSKFKDKDVDFIANRTLISSESNSYRKDKKGDKKPSEYLPLFLENHGHNEPTLLSTLQTHLISEKAYDAMKRNDFLRFIEIRKETIKEAILQRIK